MGYPTEKIDFFLFLCHPYLVITKYGPAWNREKCVFRCNCQEEGNRPQGGTIAALGLLLRGAYCRYKLPNRFPAGKPYLQEMTWIRTGLLLPIVSICRRIFLFLTDGPDVKLISAVILNENLSINITLNPLECRRRVPLKPIGSSLCTISVTVYLQFFRLFNCITLN